MANNFFYALRSLIPPSSHLFVRSFYSPSKSPELFFGSEKISNPKTPKRRRPLEPLKAISALRMEENPDKLVKLFQLASQNHRFHHHRSAYAIAVKKLADSGRQDAVEEILENEKTKPQFSPTEGFIARIITLYGQAGMPDQAVNTFRQLPDFNFKITVKSVNAILSALHRTGNFEQVCDLYREITENYKINPDLKTFKIVVTSLCQMGFAENAFSMVDEMVKYGCSSDVEIFNTILRGFYKEGKPQGVLRVLERMSQIGCFADADTYNIRILNLCREGKSYEAKELLNIMRAQGVKPNVGSYNILINGFCKEHNLAEANSVFVGMVSKGCDPNRKSYFTLIYYLCVEEEFEWALEVCEESASKNWLPNMSIMQMLVKGLVKISKAKEARRIITEVRSRLPRECVRELDEIEKKLFGESRR